MDLDADMSDRPVVRRTYGRAKPAPIVNDAMEQDPDSSMTLAGTPSQSEPSLRPLRRISSQAANEDDEPFTSQSTHVDDAQAHDHDEDAESSVGSPVKVSAFTTDWKQKLAALDASDDESETEAAPTKRAHVTSLDPQSGHTPKASRPLSRNLPNHDPASSSLATIPSSPSPAPSSARSTGARRQLPSLSIHKQHRSPSPLLSASSPAGPSPVPGKSKSKRRVLLESDEEASGSNSDSPPDPTPAAAVSSPVQSDSEPVPVTQSDHESDMPPKKATRSNKGKQRAMPPPLTMRPVNDEDLAPGPMRRANSDTQLPTTSRSAGEKLWKDTLKTKAPSKKELKETKVEKARLQAERTVHGLKPPDADPRYTVAGFMSTVSSSRVFTAANPPSSQGQDRRRNELSSDPIDYTPYKTETTLPVNAEQDMGFGISTLLASTTPSASSLNDKLPALNFSGPSKLPLSAIPDVSDDDEDMPDIDTVLKLASEQSKKKKLAEAKAAALKSASATRARAPASANVDSDSDLEITGGPSPSKKKSVNMNISVDGQPGPLRLASGTAPAPLPKRPENDRRPTRPTPAVPTSLSFASSKPGVGNGKSKPKSKGKQQPLTAKEINEETLRRAQESADAIRRQKEEDWVRRGGKVKETTVPEPVNGKDAIARYAEQARKNLENQSLKEFDNEGGTDDDGSDEEYQPELQLSGEEENDEAQDGSPHVSPSLSTIAHPGAQQSETEPDEEENDENTVPLPRRSNVRARIAAIVDSDDEAMTENDENLAPAPTPRNRNGHVLVPNSTLREGQFNINAFSRTMSDVSEEVEPDEDDKENNNMLAFEGDKENMSVVMGGSPTPRRPALGSLVGTSTRSLSSSDSLDRDASQSRTPLRELSVRKDVFGRALHDSSESPTRQGGSPFERKLRASQSPSKSIHDSPSRPQLLSKKLALSQFMDDNTQPAPAVKKGGLSQFMENTQPSLLNRKVGLSQFMDDSQPTSALLPRSGLMDAFDDDFDSPGAGPSQPQTGNDAFGRLRNVEAPSLTFDESIRPAVKLDLSEREREQAEAIFAKEQEMLIEDSMAPVATQAPLLWENTQGFLTQTKPRSRTQQPLPPLTQMLSTQTLLGSHFSGMQLTQQQSQRSRQPLRTLSYSADAAAETRSDDDEESNVGQPRRRLRRARTPDSHNSSPSSTPEKKNPDAFSMLKQGAKKQRVKEKKKIEKSEFVQAEAVESDEDGGYGIGLKGKGAEEDYESGDDQDVVVEGLLDDQKMDANTEAVDLVQEKFKEHQAEDDKVIEKHVTDAVEGKHRTKRRDRGIGFEDSDSESEDDNKPRGPKRQKRQIEGDTLDALRALPKAAPFVEVYEAALKDDDDDLAFLSKVDSHVQLDDRPSITYDRADADDDDDEEQTELTAAEAREQMRILAVNAQESRFDVEDLSFLDQQDFDEDMDSEVRDVTAHVPKKPTKHDDLDGLGLSRRRDEQGRTSTTWVKAQTSHASGSTRSAGGASVAGHARAKAGGGSLSGKAAAAPKDRRPKPSGSMLATVSSRKNKFA